MKNKSGSIIIMSQHYTEGPQNDRFLARRGDSRTCHCIDLRRERFPVEGFSAFNIAGGFQP